MHAFALNEFHGHGLIELIDDMREVRRIVGELKRVSSKAVRTQISGSIWAAGGTYKPIADTAHCDNVDEYILFKQGLDAWTWSANDATTEGMFTQTARATSNAPKPPLTPGQHGTPRRPGSGPRIGHVTALKKSHITKNSPRFPASSRRRRPSILMVAVLDPCLTTPITVILQRVFSL